MDLQAALRILNLVRPEDVLEAISISREFASQIGLTWKIDLPQRNPFESSKFKYRGWNPSGFPVVYDDPEGQFDFSDEEDCREYALGITEPLATRFSPFKSNYSRFSSFGPAEERGPCGIWRLGNNPPVEFLVYYSNKLKDIGVLKSFYVALKSAHKVLEKSGVSAAMNGISFGIQPKLQHTMDSGVTKDAFGVYAKFGRFEWLEFASQISDIVLQEFHEAIIQKIKKEKDSISSGDIDLLYKIITILHELGHRVDYTCMEPEQHRIFEFWAKWKKVLPVSKYAATSPKEWFAECFAAWVLGGLQELESIGKGELVEEFENILALVPSEVNLDPFDRLSSALAFLKESSKSLSKNDEFTMEVVYKSGPSQSITGFWGEIIEEPFPTVVYKDEDGRTRKFNFFANRQVVSINFSSPSED